MNNQNNTAGEHIRLMVLVFACILVNFLGRHLVAVLQMPLWLDSFGTVFAAYVLGPYCGAIVGIAGNIIYSFWNITSLAYALTSIFIGLSTGYAARKRKFDTFFGAMSVAGWVTIVSVFISAILNVVFYQGSTGNIWGDGVRDFLVERGVNKMAASAVGQFYLDFLDKLATILGMYALIRLVNYIRRVKKIKKPTKAHILLCLLCAAVLLQPVRVDAEGSEDTAYIRQIYNADNGLSCGHANDIVQTNDGVLWVGSYAGLYRYNGSSFRFMDSFETVKNVNCLYMDEEGRLWIGTNDNGIAISIHEKVANTLDAAQGLPSDSVKCMVQGTDGNYYIGTSAGMAIVTQKNGLAIAKVLSQIQCAVSVCADQEGNVATVTSEGKLYILREEKIAYEITSEDSEISFTTCTFSEEGVLYAGTTDGRVMSWRIGEKAAQEESSLTCGDLTKINRICMQGDATWILADNGVGRLRGEKFIREEIGEFNYSIENMAVDYQGNLWFASSRLGLLKLSETNFVNLFSKYGLESSVVNTTAVRDGELYIGTDDGLCIMSMADGTCRQNELTKLLHGSRIRCMQVDSSGRLWICSYGKGLIQVSSDGELIQYDIGKRVRVCMQLSDGSMAAGGENGLSIIRDETETVTIPYGDSLGSSQILSLCEQPDGGLLVGTDGNGILTIRDGSVEEHRMKGDGLGSDVILRMVPDGDGRLFIVTSNGICYMDKEKITPLDNFPYSNNYDMVLSDRGEMFVLGSAGIYVVKKEDLLSGRKVDDTVLNTKMGLEGALTANAWNAVTDGQELYLSTDRGVVLMNLDAWKSKKRSYRLRVAEIRIDGVSMPMERGMDLTIGRNTNSIEFFPEVVNYSLEDKEYKTVAQSELGGVVYTNLPSGRYLFHLAIRDEESGKILEESTYGFVKEQSIHDNSWFLAYMIVVGGIFLGWVTWYFTRMGLQRSLAISQERLSFALKQVQMGNETILAIAKTVDAKDVRTSRHSQRVSEYSAMIARDYGMSEEEQDSLRKAALLHDIGKIGIPDVILNKPSRLTDEEYEVMKPHVTRGAEILKDFTLVKNADLGARYHHERYDGKGYPEGLKGEEIPLYGRIISIADAFDAMTANRIYRKRLDFSYVMEELRRGRGTQFDPELLDIFVRLLENGEIDVEALYAEEITDTDSGEVQA